MNDLIKKTAVFDLIDKRISQREACRKMGIARITLSTILLEYIRDNKI